MATVKAKGIDVSYWQGKPADSAYRKYSAAGWKFLIARIGYADKGIRYEDSTFEYNMEKAKKYGIQFGVYFYSNAQNRAEGKEEAQYVLRILKKRSLQLPVWIDMEDNATSGKASKRDLAAACKAFCSTIEEEGYMAGVYASTSWFSTKIGSLGSLRKWVAQYNDKVTYGGTYDMWQYSSTATVAGFSGHRDVNRSYVLFDRQNFLIRPKVNLQIRSGQSLKSKKTGVLNKNGFYRVVRVNAKGNRGYVKGEGWVTVTSKYAQRVPGETFNIETKGNLIVRESPLLSSAKIGVLKKNRKYSVVAISQDGKRGQLKNGGWITVTNKYVKIIP
ncbi:MAG: GH25 family lysozyme [Anaerovoracaceae bacterium]